MAADKLSCESTLYWRCLCEHLRSLGAEADEFLDKVLPTGIVYAKFLRRSVSVGSRLQGRICHLKISACLIIRASSALSLLVGRQEEHSACKNRVTKCWCRYLSGVRCI